MEKSIFDWLELSYVHKAALLIRFLSHSFHIFVSDMYVHTVHPWQVTDQAVKSRDSLDKTVNE